MSKEFQIDPRVKKIAEEAYEKQGQIVITGGSRNIGKKWLQQWLISKKWPKGKIANVSTNGVRYSELADAEEIKG